MLANESDGHLNIYGEGKIDLAYEDGRYSGNFGKAAIYNKEIDKNQNITIETIVKIEYGTNLSSNIIAEADPNNRIRLSVHDIGIAGITLDENDNLRLYRKPFNLEYKKYIKLKLKIMSDNSIQAYINDQIIYDGKFEGTWGNYFAGIASTVRFPGDELYASYDNLRIYRDDVTNNQVPDIKQYSDPWGDDEYDSANNWYPTNPSIARWGCAMTSADMLLQFHNISDVNPGDLNTWLKSQPDGYNRYGGVIWNTIGRYSRSTDPESETLEFQYLADNSEQTIKNEIDAGRPPILKLANRYGGNHFVVASHVDNEDIIVNDPGSSSNSSLSDVTNYWGEVIQIGRYTPSNTDLSYIIAYSENDFNMELHRDNEMISESFGEDPIVEATGNNNNLLGEPLEALYYPKPEDGRYRLEVNGDGIFQLDTYFYDKDGYSNMNKITGIAFENYPAIYEFEFNKGSNGDSRIINADTTFESLIKEIHILYHANILKQRGLYSSLTALISNSQKAYEKDKIMTSSLLLDVSKNRLLLTKEKFISEEYKYYLVSKIDELLLSIEL